MDERAKKILSDACETLARVSDIVVEPRDDLAVALARPVEHPTDRDRRELAARDKRWKREAAREAARLPDATTSADLETWLRSRLDEERAFVLECVGQALGQALKKERAAAKRELSDEVRALRIELSAADATINELRRTLASSTRNSGAADVIDLPARRVN